MVGRGNGTLGPADLAAIHTESLKSLGTGDFMHQMQVNVQNGWALLRSVYYVLVPDFFKHGPRGGRFNVGHLVQNGEGGNQLTLFTVNIWCHAVNGSGDGNGSRATDNGLIYAKRQQRDSVVR